MFDKCGHLRLCCHQRCWGLGLRVTGVCSMSNQSCLRIRTHYICVGYLYETDVLKDCKVNGDGTQ